MTARSLELAMLCAVAALCVVLMVEAWGIRPPSHIFPLAILGLTFLFTLFALIKPMFVPLNIRLFEPRQGRVVIITAAGFVAFVIVMQFHYLIAGASFLFLGYLFLEERRSAKSILTAVVIAAVTTGFTWLVFAIWLGVDLPK